MHTHSEHSHDSVTKLEDLCLAEIGRGTQVMALTDHFDTFAYTSYDVYSPILAGYDEIQTMNGKYGDKCLFLSGVEISEGFWYPEEQRKILSLVDYDVILGSVHFTKSSRIEVPYSHIDFSDFTDEEIHEFLTNYFNDILKMLDSLDFDILCHLFCPVRYINGKYGRQLDMSIYEEKIKEILSVIIKRGIALEINTTLFAGNGKAFTKWLLEIYRKMNGYLITLASDAHIPDNAARSFDEAKALLLECGFEDVGYFESRKFYQCKIGDN